MGNTIKDWLKSNKVTGKVYRIISTCKQRTIKMCKRRKLTRNGKTVIESLQKNLSNYPVLFFFDMGTLLGAIRERGFIGHDLDIDVGVLTTPDFDKEAFTSYLINIGCKHCFRYIMDDNVTVEDSYIYNDVKFDINYYICDGINHYCFLMYRDPQRRYIDNEFDIVKLHCSMITSTKTYEFMGTQISIPNEPEQYLLERYGKDWRTPNKNYVYWEGPSAEKLNVRGKCIIYNK